MTRPSDHVHAQIVNSLCKLSKRREEIYETEVMLRSFGENSFVDLISLRKPKLFKKGLLKVMEVKTSIDDVGSTIRQIKKYVSIISQWQHFHGINLDKVYISPALFVLNTKQNYSIIKKVAHTFNVTVAMINPLSNENRFFYILDPNEEGKWDSEVSNIGFVEISQMQPNPSNRKKGDIRSQKHRWKERRYSR